MTDKEKIRAEIERRIDNLPPLNPKTTEGADATLLYGIYMSILNFIDSMQEEPTIQQMMKNAKEGVITFDYYGDNDKIYGCIAHDSFSLEELGLKDGDKVKLIIIKEGKQ